MEELRAEDELGDVVAALDGGEHERALDLLLAVAEREPDERERARRLMVAIFAELGPEHPLSLRYRRRLAAVLF